MLNPEVLKTRIAAALPGSQVTVNDLTGTNDHFEATVVWAGFDGKSMIDQHQAVYAAFPDELKSGELHALKLKTWSPAQFQKFQERQKK